MVRFCKNIFRSSHTCTSIDYHNKTLILSDMRVVLQMWDTAGQERFRAIVKEYYRKADGVLLVYDLTNVSTFHKLSSWLDELRAVNDTASVLIVGNKNDLVDSNAVSRTTVKTYAREEGIEFSETSAKNNENVDKIFQKLALTVLERKRILPFFTEVVKPKVEVDFRAERIEPEDEVDFKTQRIEPEVEVDFRAERIEPEDEVDFKTQRIEPEVEVDLNTERNEPVVEVHFNTERTEPESTSEWIFLDPEPTSCDYLPPVIKLSDTFGGDCIKLHIEQPKKKKKKCC
ncbi:GTP-binding protein YPTM1 [Caerostris extrusa]|uniref:GTP-binding protein YPTM1 n=1 Tax=Caerostris extrusa TaxID=172846 RepID=A0AAV4X881_CAEEX|nr:GTP-binding protein YPTM1 [Caerostris extrusa]